MDKSITLTLTRRLTALLLVAGIWACTPDIQSTGNSAVSEREGSMNLEKSTADMVPAIPEMDAAAPAAFETASFGLG